MDGYYGYVDVMSELKGRKIVLGVTGGVAAYKAAELTRLLGKAGASVHVVLTEGGAHFVTAVTFQALSGHPVWSDLWDPRMGNNMAHIDLSRDADLIVDRAGNRRCHREAGQWTLRRSAQHAVSGARLPAAGGAGDEPADVGAPGDAAQCRAIA